MVESWKLCLNTFRAIKCIVNESGSDPTTKTTTTKHTRGLWRWCAQWKSSVFSIYHCDFGVQDVNPCCWCIPNWIFFLCVNMTRVYLNWSTIMATIEYIFRTYSVLEKSNPFTLIHKANVNHSDQMKQTKKINVDGQQIHLFLWQWQTLAIKFVFLSFCVLFIAFLCFFFSGFCQDHR